MGFLSDVRSPSTGNTVECRIPWYPASSSNISMHCYTFPNIVQHSSPVIHPVQSLRVYQSCENQQPFQNNEIYLAFLSPYLSKDMLLKIDRELSHRTFPSLTIFARSLVTAFTNSPSPDISLVEDKLVWKISYCSVPFSFLFKIYIHMLCL